MPDYDYGQWSSRNTASAMKEAAREPLRDSEGRLLYTVKTVNARSGDSFTFFLSRAGIIGLLAGMPEWELVSIERRYKPCT